MSGEQDEYHRLIPATSVETSSHLEQLIAKIAGSGKRAKEANAYYKMLISSKEREKLFKDCTSSIADYLEEMAELKPAGIVLKEDPFAS